MPDDDLDRDIADAFAALDRIEPPRLSARIFSKAAPGAGAELRTLAVGPRVRPPRRRWLAGIAAAVALFGAGIAVGLIVRGSHSDDPTMLIDPPPTAPPPTASPTVTSPPTPYGTALVTPSVVPPGGTIAVTPDGAVYGECTRLAVVFRGDTGERLAQLHPSGGWTPIGDSDPEPTWPACDTPRSAAMIEYRLPEGIGLGAYAICIAGVMGANAPDEADPRSCGAFTVATVTAPTPSSTAGHPLRPFGDAAVVPPDVLVGQAFVVTPAGAIDDRICNDGAVVYALTSSDPVRLGQIAPDGFLPEGSLVSASPDCLSPARADPVSFVAPWELGPGSYTLCLTQQLEPAACGSFAVHAERARFGTASVEPSAVRAGDALTVQPIATIQPNCLAFASVYESMSDQVGDLILRGQLTPDGSWYAFDPQLLPGPTVPACGVAPSGDAVSYVVPPDLPAGRYVICIEADLTEDGCGTFDVATSGNDAVDPLTPGGGDG